MIPAIHACDAMRLTSIASRSPDKARELARQFQCEPETGYHALLTRDDVDAVYIPLPTGLHEEWCTRALNAGKHLLVEKSFACDLPSASRMIELADRNHLLVMENFQFQTHRQWPLIQGFMTSGELGEVHLIRSTFGFPALPRDNFRWNPDLGGGALLDAGAYMTKVSQLLLGMDLDVRGASLQMDPGTGVDLYGEAMLRNRRGQVAQVAFGFDYFYQCRVEVLGTKGRLSALRVFTAPPGHEPLLVLETPEGRTEIRVPEDNHYVNMWNRFAHEVRKGEYGDAHAALLDQARLLHEVRTKSGE
jgi:hypothetical protein